MRRFSSRPGGRLAACGLLAAIFGTAIGPASDAAAASPVIDDARLAGQFVSGLGRIVDAAAEVGGPSTLDADAAAEGLKAAEGRRIRLPAEATPCGLEPDRSLYDAVVPAVVVVGSIYKCGKCNDWHLGGMASGWLLSADGLVVTNHHVLGREPGHRFGVMTAAGDVFPVTDILAADAAGDAAILRIGSGGRELPFLTLGSSPECGAEVTVISHPVGRFYCLTEGVVSRYHRQRPGSATGPGAIEGQPPGPQAAAGDGPAAVWMSITADYAVGSSGGPVFNRAGEVVGMVSRTFSSRPGRRPRGGPASEQMVFKDCVSLDTLQRLFDTAP